jgi:5'-methylthioadenosine phosphorylase
MDIKPEHIKLKKGQIAERLLVAGDTQRIHVLSSILEDAKLLNEYRYIVYTGKYKGKPVSLMSHGIGAPSAAIAIEEAHALGANKIIRLGTTGGLLKEMKYGDLIVPTAAGFDKGGVIGAYIKGVNIAPAPDLQLTNAIVNELGSRKDTYFVGPVYSADGFYREDGLVKKLSSLGFVSVEMECATLFMLGQLRGFKSASILIMVDNRVNPAMQEFLAVKEMNRFAKIAAETALNALVSD